MENINEPIGILVVLMADRGQKSSLWLPGVPQGRYYFEDSNDMIKSNLFIEGYDDKWYVYCTSPAVLTCDGQRSTAVELRDRMLFQVEVGRFSGAIYVEWENRDSMVFRNYLTHRLSQIRIGRSADNDIIYANRYVSRHHASLKMVNGYWKIVDENSVNHIYVNGERVTETYLNVGDTIYIVGLQIIIGVGFIAINDGNARVMLTNADLFPITSTQNIGMLAQTSGGMVDTAFNRLPRQRLALKPEEIEIEGPPMSLNSDKIPLLLRMGGSMVMGGSAALMGHFTTLISSVLFPMLTQKYTDKEKKEYETRRIQSYTAYLRKMEAEIQTEKVKEQKILNQNYPDFREILTYTDQKRKLWERRKTDDDFLSVRLGYGQVPFMGKVNYPRKRYDMDEDVLEEKMYALAERDVYLENVPIQSSLTQNFVCGLTGRREETITFIQTLLMQIAILHSYDEVKTVILLEKEDLERMDYLKYLPHAWDDRKSIRFIATDYSEAYQISEYLKNEIAEDMVKPRPLKEILKGRPYYVVFALSKRIFDSMEVLKEAMQLDSTCGVSILTMFDDLPKECFQLFNIGDMGTNTITHLKEIERGNEHFRLDFFEMYSMRKSAKILANTDLKLLTESYSLPKMLTFLEMFGVGRVEHLNPIKRWSENDPVKSLSTPVGVGTDGSLLPLDLHQKFEGPHGLIAGMTGSGKSEFILTYILSMAINYHPDEVAFILIDYKGGGLAGAFEDKKKGIHLPHLVGTITNLDGSEIQRSLISIQSELKRRQRVFNETKSDNNEGTMDIYKYQKLYRQHVVKEPMPHLFIISDEFAELKQQEPEFMEQLISTARIGRSLGVHLILATQKPAGVVNDQILSNTKFRVCLKVQDRADSMDMLKRPEAAELIDTGRFYLQVGYNEHFALGQSAWCGAPYQPQNEVVVQKENSILFVDTVGQTIHTVKPEKVLTSSGKTQLVEIVQLLSDTAMRMGLKENKLWKDPLPEQLDMHELDADNTPDPEKKEIKASLGMLDDPENQSQFPMMLDIRKMKNLLVVGEAGSGKTTFFQSMILSLADRYSPEEVQFYILDYSSRTLCKLASLPHCGAALSEADEGSLDNFFNLINELIAERKRLFNKLEVDSFEAACSVTRIPLILVFVDNITGMNVSKVGQAQYYKFQDYLKNGLNYGIKFMVSCNHLNEVSLKIKQELAERISFHVKDRYEFSDVLGYRCSYTPPDLSGRGLCMVDGRPLEMQIASYCPKMDVQKKNLKLKKAMINVCEKYSHCKPPKKLAVVSETENYQDFMVQFTKGRLPLGYSLKDAKAVALPYKQFSMMSLFFGNPAGVKPVLDNFIQAARFEGMEITVIKKEKGSLFSAEHSLRLIEATKENLEQLGQDIVAELMNRKELLVNYCNAHGLDARRPDIYMDTHEYMYENTRAGFYIFEDFQDVCGKCDEASVLIFSKIFELAKQYNMYFLGCFYPSDKMFINSLAQAFNPDALTMLFGGQYHKQSLVRLPMEYSQINKKIPYNRCVMRYRDELYSMLVPCGEMNTEEENQDDRNIFE